MKQVDDEMSLWDKIKEKTKAAWDWTKETTEIVVELAKEDPKIALALISGVFTVGGGAVTTVVKRRQKLTEKKDKERDIYDPHVGQHYILKRPMNKKEQRVFNEKVKKIRAKEIDDTYYDIFEDMGLL